MKKETKKPVLETAEYWPYILEIRRRLIVVLIFFLVGFLLGFFLFRPLIFAFLSIFNLSSVKMVVTSPFQVFNLAVNCGLFTGTVLAAPAIIFNFISFIKKALNQKERKLILPALIISIILFMIGFGFGLGMMRWVIISLSSSFALSALSNYWDVNLFISQIFLTAAVLGLIFELPLFIFFLVKLNLISMQSLVNKRVFIWIGIIILTALLPPTDALSLIIMALSLIALYEITLFFLKKTIKEVKVNVR